jgi:hypothetical protein
MQRMQGNLQEFFKIVLICFGSHFVIIFEKLGRDVVKRKIAKAF